MLHRTMLIDSSGILATRSTSRSDRDRRDRADQQGCSAQQPDLGDSDVQRGLELGRDRTDRRQVGAVQRQHQAEQDNDAGSSGPPDALDDLRERAATTTPSAFLLREPAGRQRSGFDVPATRFQYGWRLTTRR